MPAGQYNLLIEQGATFERTVVWKDSEGNPVNLTGFTARMQIRKYIGGPIVTSLTTENGGLTLGTTNGTIDLILSAEDTADLESQSGYVYDLELESSGGIVTRLMKGTVTIDPEVTR